VTEAATDAFVTAVSYEIAKFDAFASEQASLLRSKFEGASSDMIKEIESEMTTLRHYVALNVIAATKIVKKHDKHAGAECSRRTTIGLLVYTSSGIQMCRKLHTDISAKSGTMPPRAQSDEVNLHVEGTGGGDDDEEGDQVLRALPNWLLKDLADVQNEAHQNEAPQPYVKSFYTTFLSDWSGARSERVTPRPLARATPALINVLICRV
jgi:hypothetical protein